MLLRPKTSTQYVDRTRVWIVLAHCHYFLLACQAMASKAVDFLAPKIKLRSQFYYHKEHNRIP